MNIKAFAFGFVDGWKQPEDLTTGRTWEDGRDENESYDRGVNVGQVTRLFARVLRTRGYYSIQR